MKGGIGKWAIVGVFCIKKGIFVCQTLKSCQVSNEAPKALIGNNNRWTLNLKVSGKNSFAGNGNLNNRKLKKKGKEELFELYDSILQRGQNVSRG